MGVGEENGKNSAKSHRLEPNDPLASSLTTCCASCPYSSLRSEVECCHKSNRESKTKTESVWTPLCFGLPQQFRTSRFLLPNAVFIVISSLCYYDSNISFTHKNTTAPFSQREMSLFERMNFFPQQIRVVIMPKLSPNQGTSIGCPCIRI